MRNRVFLLTLLSIGLSTGVAYGQSAAGTILGIATDVTGAALPGAQVTTIHTATNSKRSVLTNASGNYSVPNLQIGVYDIEASLDGFQSVHLTGITLQVGQKARIDLTFDVGQVRQVVEVSAETPLLQTDSSSVGAVIDAGKLDQILLNGRQFEDLVQLAPGAVTPAQGSELGARGGFNIAGFDENYNSFFLDGLDNVDPVLRNFSFRPSIDMIEEFKIEESNYAAEFGRNAGAVINVTTKSGSNQFHGSVWEYIRNDNLDARNVFATEPDADSSDPDLRIGVPKPDLIRNQFGAAIGGPIAADRTFFFAAYEGLREKNGQVRRATSPTERMRRGDFGELAQPIVDPLSGQPFPNNVIPEARMHPITRGVIDAYPLPNIAGRITRNRIEIANRIEDADDVSVRLDHHLSDAMRLMARYSFSDARIFDPFRTENAAAPFNLKDFGQTADRTRTSGALSLTTVLGNEMVHEFRAGYSRFNQPLIPIRPLPPEQQPIAGEFPGFQSFTPIDSADTIGSGQYSGRVVNVYNYIDQLSWVRGDHNLKFGVDARRYLFNAFSGGPNQFVFSSIFTGYGLADMLLGYPWITVSYEGLPRGNPRKTEFAAYAQDDWRLTPSLTLNYGLRWEWYGRVTENVNRQSTWDPGCNCILVAGADAPPGLVDNDWNNFAPRFGFAYRPSRSLTTVFRAGGGVYYDSEQRHNFPLFANPPWMTVRQFITSPANPLTMDDPFLEAGGAPLLNLSAIERNYRDTYAEHWNFGVQQMVLEETILEVSYVGNHVVKAQRVRDVNQPIPGSGRPYPGFHAIRLSEQAGSSLYHSLQTRLERRFFDRLAFTSSYTWAHAIDDRPGQATASHGGFQNAHNPGRDRADADFDVRHRYTFSWVYELPALQDARGLHRLLSGWSMNGLLILQSGRPFTVTQTHPTFNGLRPDRVVGVDPAPAHQGADNWINPAAFAATPPGAFGNVGRNTLRGPALRNLDLSLVRRFTFEERELEFRAEFFNLTNTPHFALPNRNFGSVGFGEISATVGVERQIQFALRYEF